MISMKEMTGEELLVFMRTIVENGESLESALEKARLVDDLLTLKKAHILGSKLKKGTHRGSGRPNKEMLRLSSLLDARIEYYIDQQKSKS